MFLQGVSRFVFQENWSYFSLTFVFSNTIQVPGFSKFCVNLITKQECYSRELVLFFCCKFFEIVRCLNFRAWIRRNVNLLFILKTLRAINYTAQIFFERTFLLFWVNENVAKCQLLILFLLRDSFTHNFFFVSA